MFEVTDAVFFDSEIVEGDERNQRKGCTHNPNFCGRQKSGDHTNQIGDQNKDEECSKIWKVFSSAVSDYVVAESCENFDQHFEDGLKADTFFWNHVISCIFDSGIQTITDDQKQNSYEGRCEKEKIFVGNPGQISFEKCE